MNTDACSPRRTATRVGQWRATRPFASASHSCAASSRDSHTTTPWLRLSPRSPLPSTALSLAAASLLSTLRFCDQVEGDL